MFRKKLLCTAFTYELLLDYLDIVYMGKFPVLSHLFIYLIMYLISPGIYFTLWVTAQYSFLPLFCPSDYSLFGCWGLCWLPCPCDILSSLWAIWELLYFLAGTMRHLRLPLGNLLPLQSMFSWRNSGAFYWRILETKIWVTDIFVFCFKKETFWQN